jgi:hypothetical protein
MDLRFLRLRAVGPPLVVAAVSVAALVWFDKIWIPAQQQYLNERNLRVLRTISAQIKAKVDNFDQAIDHAIDSFPFEKGDVDLLQKYVRLLSRELEIVTDDPNNPAWKKVTPGDPPNVRIQRDEGRNYLYLGYRHEKEHRKGRSAVSLIARGDIDQVTARSLTRKDFDALLLLDDHGATIAQQSSAGLELTSIAKLRDRGQSAASSPNGVFERLRGTTGLAVVTIGAADYMLYTQPLQLSLIDEEKRATQTPEEWTLCGLVRLDRFRAASSTIPTTYWLCFGAVLAFICFAIPLLKLRVLSPRERLTRFDSVSIAAAIFMLMALATFTAQDVRMFGAIVPAAVDDQIRRVAASMLAHVRLEAAAVDSQMSAFSSEALWQQLKYNGEEFQTLRDIRTHLSPDEDPLINLGGDASGRSQCKPSWSCRAGVLGQLGRIDYPFLKMMVWTDEVGGQRIKWSISPAVTPFVNIGEAKVAYFESLRLARRLYRSNPNVPMDGVSVITSANTGEKLTAFWRALPPLEGPPLKSDVTGMTLLTTPVSLSSPVLPKNVQFAVVDRTGLVLFHSDATRSLTENFFQESEESPALKSLVAGRDSGAFGARYMGRSQRFFVTPLDVAPFGDPRWSLVVFQADAVSETANLETINLAASLFVLYVLALAAIWALMGFFHPDAVRKMLWPIPSRGPLYRRAAMVGTAVGVTCMGALALGPSTMLIAGAAASIVGAVVVMFVIVRAGPESSRVSPTWLAGFLWARASLLLLLAAVPATLCFQIAYAFHAELVMKRGESHLAGELSERARRINSEARKAAICGESDRGSQPCDKVRAFVARRAMDTLWDVDVPATRDRQAATADEAVFAPAALRPFLRLAYRPFNDIAADLLMTSASQPGQGLDRWRLTIGGDGRETFDQAASAASDWRFAPAIAPRPPVNGVPWAIAAALMGLAYLLVRYLLQPIFALGLEPRAAMLAPTGPAEDTSLLVLGPPGSRRTERLQGHPRVRIFDVRSLAFADNPMAATVSDVRLSTAADCGHCDQIDSSWPDAILAATSHPFTIVALDHLEHRLDDQAFRGRMLECLESAVYRHGAAVWCSSVRDPIELLEELDPPAPDRRRWARVLEGFRREHLGLEIDQARSSALATYVNTCANDLAPDVRKLIVSECEAAPELLAIGETLAARLPAYAPLNAEQVLAEIASGARPFYEAVWSACTTDEKVALRQLAEEGLVNPNNAAAISRMLSAGLVRRRQTFQVMNETFRRFVIGAASNDVIAAWEREGVRVPWGTIATTGVTVAFGLAGLLLLTQEQLVDAWISYVPALAPAIPTVWKVLASGQKGRVDVTA